MFYGSMETKGLCLKNFCVLHMDNRQKKKKNFKVTENNMVIKISTHLQQPSQKRFKANYHPGA